jgi:hypothetical protein
MVVALIAASARLMDGYIRGDLETVCQPSGKLSRHR